MSAPKQYQALTPNNQFVFQCPIFKADSKISTCFKLDQKKKRGEQIEVRQGCQACMNAGLCPIPHLVKMMFREGKELCYSPTPKKGKLPDAILERIRPIVVLESHMSMLNVPPAERKLIEAASGLNGSIPKGSGVSLKDVTSEPAEKPKKTRKAASKPTTTNHTAAETGDMSAAINQAMETAA